MKTNSNNNYVTFARHGFTLVEVLLAMLITSVLVLGLNAAFKQAHLITSHAENSRPMYQNARLITDLLRKELSGLYVPHELADNASCFQLTDDTLEFFTLTPSFTASSASCHMAKVRYNFAKDVLHRHEESYAGEKQIATQVSDIAAKGLSKFKISVYDRDEKKWKDQYTSKQAPPGAVKVSFCWAKTDDTPKIDFESAFLITCQGTIIQ